MSFPCWLVHRLRMALVQAMPSLPVSSPASRNELVKRRQKCAACSVRQQRLSPVLAEWVPSDEAGQVVAVGAGDAFLDPHDEGGVVCVSIPAAIRMSHSSPGEPFRYSRRVPVALETAWATSSMVNGGPPSSYAAFRWLSWVSAVTQAAA